MRQVKKNRFMTLADALCSENLFETWQLHFPGIAYGQTFSYTYDDGSKYGRYVSITRFEDGTYERPVHYSR
jgi:hypothetical protein